MADRFAVLKTHHSNGGMKSCITPLTSTHSQNNWSPKSHKFEIVTCNNCEFMVV